MTYTPLELVDEAAEDIRAPDEDATRDPNRTRDLAPGTLRTAPKGGIDGVDWSLLYGSREAAEEESLELCCFLTHQGTSTEAAIWRDVERRLVVRSRGHGKSIRRSSHQAIRKCACIRGRRSACAF